MKGGERERKRERDAEKGRKLAGIGRDEMDQEDRQKTGMSGERAGGNGLVVKTVQRIPII